MPKKQLLPPSGDSHKREVSVNLRFSLADHLRLKQVAEFSAVLCDDEHHASNDGTSSSASEQIRGQ